MRERRSHIQDYIAQLKFTIALLLRFVLMDSEPTCFVADGSKPRATPVPMSPAIVNAVIAREVGQAAPRCAPAVLQSSASVSSIQTALRFLLHFPPLVPRSQCPARPLLGYQATPKVDQPKYRRVYPMVEKPVFPVQATSSSTRMSHSGAYTPTALMPIDVASRDRN